MSRARAAGAASAGTLAIALILSGCATVQPDARGGASRAAAPAPAAAAGRETGHAGPSRRQGNAPFYEVAGRRYYVLAEAGDYRDRGVASWYGPDFHGRATASGEVYDMHQLTAAHKTLPIPSWVKVRNLHNGREVVVRINDRGPFVKNRLIDLSYEAARRLELIGPGTAPVEVALVPAPGGTTGGPRQVSGAPPRTAGAVSARDAAWAGPAADAPGTAAAPVAATPVRAPAAAAPGNGGFHGEYYVQVGAFSDAANAERMRTRLLGLGFDDVVVHRGQPPEPAFRVRVGPFRNPGTYDEIVERMRLVDIHDTYLTIR